MADLFDFLLPAFMPFEPLIERAAGYRQWRLLKGETALPEKKHARLLVTGSDFE